MSVYSGLVLIANQLGSCVLKDENQLSNNTMKIIKTFFTAHRVWCMDKYMLVSIYKSLIVFKIDIT